MTAFLLIYIATIIVVTRIRAELGSPVHDFHFIGGDNILSRGMGASQFTTNDQLFFAFGYTLTRAHRSDTMPVGLESLQMAHQKGIDSRKVFTAIVLATILGTISAFWAFEHQAYQFGVSAKFNQGFGQANEAMTRTANWIGGTLDPHANVGANVALSSGFISTLGLMALRSRSYGFPFHPIGFAISSSWAINLVWMPMLISWLLKSFTMRYGGLRSYRMFLPFFLGLVLGDCVQGSFWGLMSIVLNTRTYNFFGG